MREIVQINKGEYKNMYGYIIGNMCRYEDGAVEVDTLYIKGGVLIKRGLKTYVSSTIKVGDELGFDGEYIYGTTSPNVKVDECYTIDGENYIKLNVTSTYGSVIRKIR